MIKYFIGWLFILLSIAVPVLFFLYNIKFIWYFSESYKIYDLIYSLVSLIAFIYGIRVVSKRSGLSLIILITTIFVVYQVLGWQIDARRFTSNLQLDQNFYLALKPYDGGALTTTSFTKLVLLERKYLFLIVENQILKSYDSVSSGELKFKKGGIVNVELVTYSKEVIIDSVSIEDLF